MELLEALEALKPGDDVSWTADGLPSIEALTALTGTAIERADITAAAPELTRESRRQSHIGTGTGSPPEPVEDTVDASKRIAAALADADAKISLLMVERDGTDAKIRALTIQRNRIHDTKASHSGHKENIAAIARVRAASRKGRRDAANRIKTALGGLTPKQIAALDPRAKVDQPGRKRAPVGVPI